MIRRAIYRRWIASIAFLSLLLYTAGETRALTQDTHQQPPPAPAQGDYAISVTVPVVNVDVVVTDNNGNFLTGLKKENFRITEDGVTQQISNFATSEAPITIVLLL
jgi:hypothetical protein